MYVCVTHFNPYLTTYTQNNSKLIIILEPVKLREENLYDLGLSGEFLDMTPKAWFKKGWVDKLGSAKLKTSLLQHTIKNEKIN